MIKKYWKLLFFFVFIIIAFIYYKTIYNKIVFKRITLESNNEIDTLERYHRDSLLLVDILDYGFLGHFSMNVGYIRNFGNGSSIIYQSNIRNKFSISINQISETDLENQKIAWGWYCVGKNSALKSLPKIEKIEDSLKSIYPPENFITDNNRGFISIFFNGKQVKAFNYGNIITNDSITKFENLEFGLYELNNNRFSLVSNNCEDLFKKGEGVFFVPKPGSGVIKKFKKMTMDSILMSFHSFAECPNRIAINPE